MKVETDVTACFTFATLISPRVLFHWCEERCISLSPLSFLMEILMKQKSDLPYLIGLPKEDCSSGHIVTERIEACGLVLYASPMYTVPYGNPKVLTLLKEFHPSQSWVSSLWCSLPASFRGVIHGVLL